jgi:CheY-like chemotaxis protein
MKTLVVDDEVTMIQFVCMVAQGQGVTDIDTAESGEDALTKVIRTDYDLILLDIQMPGVSGLEILSLIRDMCPHAIIAIVSGYIPDKVSPEVAGCADVMIPKPVPLSTFEALFQSAGRICEEVERIKSLGIMPLVTA